jgi:diketogulonate reductase-like aldo/keto reductase
VKAISAFRPELHIQLPDAFGVFSGLVTFLPPPPPLFGNVYDLMTTRRDFIKAAGTAALLAPWAGNVLPGNKKQMHTRLIPGSGESLPIVGYGNSQAFRNGDLELSRQLVEILLDHGGSYIDAGGSSALLLAGIMKERQAREDLFLGTYIRSLDEAAMRKEANGVIEAQGGGPLDLVLSANLEEYGANSDKFQRLKEEGLTRFVGVARHRQSYHQEMMNLMETGAVDFVQVNYSLLEPEAEERLLPMARDKGVAILVNRPFVNGQYFPLVKGHELPPWAAEFDCHSWAQFSIKFIVSHPAVTCVLTETSNPGHAADNLAGGIGRLPDEKTRQRMREVIRSLTP